MEILGCRAGYIFTVSNLFLMFIVRKICSLCFLEIFFKFSTITLRFSTFFQHKLKVIDFIDFLFVKTNKSVQFYIVIIFLAVF